MPPTDRQRRLLRKIVGFAKDNGCMPTIRELADALGVASPNGVMCHLLALKKKGYLDWVPKASRRITLTGLRMQTVYVPGEDGQRLQEALEAAQEGAQG